MVEEKIAHNENCTSGAHNEHLCFLVREGFYDTNKDVFKAMVQDARYRCQICGRTAKSEKNLCDPVAL